MEKVTVVILNYKVKNQVLKCIHTLADSDYQNFDIVVVDNNSNDGLKEEITKFSDIHYIENKDNLGYTGGNNIGIQWALGNRSDYIFILNPDTEITKNTISELIKIMKQYQVGIGAPRILFSDKKTIWFAGGIFDKHNVIGTHRGLNEIDKGQYNKIEEIDYATGCALMVSSEVFMKIGLFDGKYFMYYEDNDFCQRAKVVGFKILYIPSAVVYHNNAQSTGLGSLLQDYFITRNRMIYASKFLPLRTKIALFREALRNLFNPVRRLALMDYLLGNFGKGSFIK